MSDERKRNLICRCPACAGDRGPSPTPTVSTGVGGDNLRLTREEIQRHNDDLAVDDEINRRRMGRHFEPEHWGI